MNRDPSLKLTKTFTEEFKEYCEEQKRKEPLPIFMGAVLAGGECLKTNKERIYNLFLAMQNGEFTYPVSFQKRLDYIEIYPSGITHTSEQLNHMFDLLTASDSGVEIWQRLYEANPGFYFRLTDDGKHDFLEEWADDYEALEFFTRCAEYLAIKD